MLYDDLDKLLAKNIDRREFLRRAAVAGTATPATLAFLAGCGAATTTTNQKIGPPQGVTAAYTAAHPMSMNIWEFDPDIVQKSISQFNSQYTENVNLAIIPGDYATGELDKLLSNAPMNMAYSQWEVVKFFKAGYIQPLDDLWGIDQIKQATFPTQWDAQSYQGHVLGLPYFNSVKRVPTVNTILAQKVGLTNQYPKSWSELYSMARAAQKTGGLPGPAYLPVWVPTTFEIANVWISETLNRGGQVFDANFNPVFDSSGEAAHVLEDWHSLYKDGIVPSSAITSTVDELIDGMASGRYLFSASELYEIYRLNDPSRSRMAGHIAFVPYGGNDWGYFNYGLYSAIVRPGRSVLDLERTLQMIRYFGYQDKNGNYAVMKQWVLRENLGSGYPAVYQDPEVQAYFATWQPSASVVGYQWQAESQTLQQHAHKMPIWNAPWYQDFNAGAIPLLTSAISGSKSVNAVITGLRQNAEKLIQVYK
jgi:multiple sugar transport system substrate-binding protein